MGGRKKKDSQLVQSSLTMPLVRLWDTLRGRSQSTSRKRGSNTDAGGTTSSGAQGSSVSAPIVQVSHSQASAEIVVQEAAPPQRKSALQVWAKALELAEKKLNKNNLPPFNLTNLTSQSAEENIEAVVKALNAVQEDDKKKRWSYTWRG
ncbi:hypothetical protein L211DRAFT_431834, partial [Terfezia boudieri ATCC MYA-4762]